MKTGRNDPCPCGSGRKFKVCCLAAGAVPTGQAQRPPPPLVAARTALELAGRLLAEGKHEAAIAPFLEAARLVPNNPLILSDLGAAYLQSGRVPEAITWLRRALAVGPTIARTHHNLGAALEQAEDYPAALIAYQRAVALAPKLAEAHGRIADLLMPMGLRSEAATAFDRAAEAAGDSLFGGVCRAKASIVRARMDEAEEGLRRLLERAPSSPEAHELLGYTLNETGRFDEAATHIEQSIALSSRKVSGYYALVTSRRMTESDRPLLGRVLARLDDTRVPERQRITLHFAAGKALDDLQDYAGAMQHFDEANRLRHRFSRLDKHFRFERDELEQRVDRLIARFTPDFFAAHASMGKKDETPVLVLGMPRSGTTLIERIVSSHPGVRGGGELEYWNLHGRTWADAPIDRLTAAADGIYAAYRDVLRAIGPEALRVTDKMPFNFLWIGLVHLIFPDAKFIHCRRNAVDTCLSIYTTHFAVQWGFASDRGDLAFYYRQYLRLMDHWRAVLPAGRLLEVAYEDVTADPEGCARRLIAFAGLDWDPLCLSPEKNPEVVKTASQWQARQPIYRRSVERWRNYEPWLGELRELAPPG